MYKFTLQDKLDSVVDDYARQYRMNMVFADGSSSDSKLESLKQLNPVTKQEVDRIIGNDSWISMYCDECGKSVDATIQLGQEPDYDSRTTNVCIECLKKAIAL